MSKIKNAPNAANEVVNVNRAQIGHRATWMALIFDEMRKAGVPNAEEIVRKAIRRTGGIHGAGFYDNMADKNNAEDFKNAFLNEVGIATFNMTPSADYDNVHIDFHYCPLVTAWQDLGFSDEDCDLLCDMAMDGDRGIADACHLKLDLDETIAKGCETCKLHFHK